MNTPTPARDALAESEFHRQADALIDAIDNALDASAAAAEAGIDCAIEGGILVIEFADGGKIVVNRQTPLREMWLAAKGGGFHFRLVDGEWIDTRGAQRFGAVLRRALEEQSGTVIDITI
jgi:CyaY protein